MNSKGLSTDPWRTPTVTLKGLLDEPFNGILDWALLYITLTKRMIRSSTPSFLKLHNITLQGILSKAFLTSKKQHK